MVKFDDILEYLGGFGPFQKRIFCLLCFLSAVLALHIFSPVFILAETDHWCYVPQLEQYYNANCTNENTYDFCLETFKNFTIPFEESDGACGDRLVYSKCYRHNITAVDFHPGEDVTKYTNTTTKCDHGWTYDRSTYKSTVIQEFNLVCDRYYLASLSSSVYMLGVFLAPIPFGYLADRIGRLATAMIGAVGMTIFGIVSAFPPNTAAFITFRFLTGFIGSGLGMASGILGTELVGPSWRIFTQSARNICFSVGYMLLAALAYFIREWWILQLVIGLCIVPLLSVWWVAAESPRWLLATGRTKKAEKLIRKIDRVNSTNVPETVFDEIRAAPEITNKEEDHAKQCNSRLDLFRYPNLRKRTVKLFFCWFTVSLVYYGLSLNTSNLGGNDYLNTAISGAVEIPANAASLYIPETVLGRRWSMCGTFVVGGVTLITALFAPSCEMEWIGITLAMIGKFCITIAFTIIYVFTEELYPTPLRATGFGLCFMCSRIGAVLAPQMLTLRTLWTHLPGVIFGVFSILSGLLMLSLPETRKEKLLETVAEGEEFGKKMTQDAGQDADIHIGHINMSITSNVDIGIQTAEPST
ncbi:organic cation transporter protein-like [Ptychodera flava]|uniref:organic cation transporter protein-like n=1 Tax=Ptychodera flava TaxID=63121 RepID=UPI003969C284